MVEEDEYKTKGTGGIEPNGLAVNENNRKPPRRHFCRAECSGELRGELRAYAKDHETPWTRPSPLGATVVKSELVKSMSPPEQVGQVSNTVPCVVLPL